MQITDARNSFPPSSQIPKDRLDAMANFITNAINYPDKMQSSTHHWRIITDADSNQATEIWALSKHEIFSITEAMAFGEPAIKIQLFTTSPNHAHLLINTKIVADVSLQDLEKNIWNLV